MNETAVSSTVPKSISSSVAAAKKASLPWRVARRLIYEIRRIMPHRASVRYRGFVLPHPRTRSRMCGREYESNEFFLESGRAEARRLVTKLGYRSDSRIVEIGSGLGRFAIGVLQEVGEAQYWGFDPVRPWLDWCRKNIGRNHPSFRFTHIDVENELYNPAGAVAAKKFHFPVADGHADIVYMWGVFTNMRLSDAHNYIEEIGRITREGGRVFLTAFVEDSVPKETINPVNYVDYECDLPLQVVRFEKQSFFSVFEKHGLMLEEFAHHAGSHCNQSEIYLRKVGNDR